MDSSEKLTQYFNNRPFARGSLTGSAVVAFWGAAYAINSNHPRQFAIAAIFGIALGFYQAYSNKAPESADKKASGDPSPR